MPILLKDILKEIEQPQDLLKIQFYCDMDGVLVDMEEGFKKISGGLSPKAYEATHKDDVNAFWNLINQIDPATKKLKYPNFWFDLKPLPDAKILWDYIQDNFKTPLPVILSAGDEEKNPTIEEQKTQWIRKQTYIDPSVQVLIADKGTNKPNYILNPSDKSIIHMLLDDTPENITAWEGRGSNMFAILHIDAASSIPKIKNILDTLRT